MKTKIDSDTMPATQTTARFNAPSISASAGVPRQTKRPLDRLTFISW
jgi:hypothetical protein